MRGGGGMSQYLFKCVCCGGDGGALCCGGDGGALETFGISYGVKGLNRWKSLGNFPPKWILPTLPLQLQHGEY